MNWTEIMITIITAVIAPSILMLVSSGMKLLLAKTEAVENDDVRKLISNCLYELADVVAVAVDEVQETYVKALKENDTFTDEHGKEAFAKAFARVKEIASDFALETVAVATGNLDAWITAQIEHRVSFK